MSTDVKELVSQAVKIREGQHESIKPGEPLRFTEASVPGDRIDQGDVHITIRRSPPEGYKEGPPVRKMVPSATDTEGSRHCLSHTDSMRMWFPENWTDVNSTAGPYVECEKEVTVEHPRHGHVTIPGGMPFQIGYQRTPQGRVMD